MGAVAGKATLLRIPDVGMFRVSENHPSSLPGDPKAWSSAAGRYDF
jgi:hypothetical protein